MLAGGRCMVCLDFRWNTQANFQFSLNTDNKYDTFFSDSVGNKIHLKLQLA